MTKKNINHQNDLLNTTKVGTTKRPLAKIADVNSILECRWTLNDRRKN
jgi:hypothetical protein